MIVLSPWWLLLELPIGTTVALTVWYVRRRTGDAVDWVRRAGSSDGQDDD